MQAKVCTPYFYTKKQTKIGKNPRRLEAIQSRLVKDVSLELYILYRVGIDSDRQVRHTFQNRWIHNANFAAQRAFEVLPEKK